MGKSVFSIISFKTGIIYFPVALGSPGPLDKNIPLGLYSIISGSKDFDDMKDSAKNKIISEKRCQGICGS